MKGHQYESAARELNEALKLSPDESTVHNNLGVALTELGRLEDAVGHLRKALELNPQFAEAYNNFGEALARKGRVKDALRDSRRRSSSIPTTPTPRRISARALGALGAGRRGDPHLKRAVERQARGAGGAAGPRAMPWPRTGTCKKPASSSERAINCRPVRIRWRSTF